MDYRQSKRDYLVGRLIAGAKALNEFFDVVSNPGQNPIRVARELSQKYELTQNQVRNLEGIASRTKEAQDLVNSAIKEYGLTKEGNFRHGHALYRRVFGLIPPRGEYFSATPHSFAIGFCLPKRCFPDNTTDDGKLVVTLGEVVGGHFISKSIPEHRLSPPRFRSTLNLMLISYTMNYEDVFFSYLYGFNKDRHTHKHELRHIIDNIISFHTPLSESAAYLFENDSAMGFRIDAKNIQRSLLDTVTKKSDRMTENVPQDIADFIYKGIEDVAMKNQKKQLVGKSTSIQKR